jgi:3-oxoacyl-[acyl-carrier-protein] synthase-1
MVTSVGLSAAETAASVRSSIKRIREIPQVDRALRPIRMARVPDDCLPELGTRNPGRPWEDRLVRLGLAAFGEGRGKGRGLPPPPLFLALPRIHEIEDDPADPYYLLDRLHRESGGAFDLVASDASHLGRGGGLAAVARAAEAVQSGQLPLALAGGMDSHELPRRLANLDEDGRLASDSNPDGLVPGEGAAFLLILSPQMARSVGLEPLARIAGTAHGFEAGHFQSEEPYQGDGLATTVRDLLDQGTIGSKIRTVYSPMNGEPYWSKEWGVTLMRNVGGFDDDAQIHQPADSYGDPGAACGPLLAGLASMGIAESYRKAPCLVYASSDDGERVTLLLDSAG